MTDYNTIRNLDVERDKIRQIEQNLITLQHKTNQNTAIAREIQFTIEHLRNISEIYHNLIMARIGGYNAD